jgi:hypothetical protein
MKATVLFGVISAGVGGLGIYPLVDLFRHREAYPRIPMAFGYSQPAFDLALILILIGVKIV